ncbi:hypothetical protein Zmor_016377 [Zophobas morio]|uniref:TGS domain-containing protein n=1 Tax=Zophobas morio TaxID=2755281 RepID=A0AA38HGD3_9CUCU|nr:hypothetical protein Zmor_016377 [Zophobas morio]
MKISLLDGSVREFENGITITEIASSIATSLGKQTLGALINGTTVVPSASKVHGDCKLEFITIKNDLEKKIAGYTAGLVAHVAVRTMRGISAIKIDIADDGTFSIFFDTDKPFNKEELIEIEKLAMEKTKTTKITSTGIPYQEDEFSKELAKNYIGTNTELLKKMNAVSYLKFDSFTISDFPERSFVPLCALYEDCSKIKSIKLLSSSAYLFEEGGKTYQVIKGIGATDTAYVEEFVKAEEEKKKRDHRYIGKQLEIFTLDPLIGQGLPI